MVDDPGLFLKEHRGRLPGEGKGGRRPPRTRKEEGTHTDGGRLPILVLDDKDVLRVGLVSPLVVRGFSHISEEGGRNLPLTATGVEIQILPADEGGHKDLQIGRLPFRVREEVGLPAGGKSPQIANQHLELADVGDFPDLDEIVRFEDQLILSGDDHGRKPGWQTDLVTDEVWVGRRVISREGEVVVAVLELQPEGRLLRGQGLHLYVSLLGDAVGVVVVDHVAVGVVVIACHEGGHRNDEQRKSCETFHENPPWGLLEGAPCLLLLVAA